MRQLSVIVTVIANMVTCMLLHLQVLLFCLIIQVPTSCCSLQPCWHTRLAWYLLDTCLEHSAHHRMLVLDGLR